MEKDNNGNYFMPIEFITKIIHQSHKSINTYLLSNVNSLDCFIVKEL